MVDCCSGPIQQSRQSVDPLANRVLWAIASWFELSTNRAQTDNLYPGVGSPLLRSHHVFCGDGPLYIQPLSFFFLKESPIAFSLSRLWRPPGCPGTSLPFRASPCLPHYLRYIIYTLPSLLHKPRHRLAPLLISPRLLSRSLHPVSHPWARVHMCCVLLVHPFF